MISASLVSATPTLVDPSEVTLFGMGRGREPAGEKKRPDESPKPSKKKSNSKPTSDNLKSLDDKWSQRFARLEAMLLAKSFPVPVELVKKPTAVVTSDQPFFYPGPGPSMSVPQPAEVFSSASSVQATGDVTASHPCEAPGTMRESAATMTATRPVEALSTGRLATQPEALVRGWPPSLLRLPVTELMCTLSTPVPVVEMAVLWTRPSPVVDLLLLILVSLT